MYGIDFSGAAKAGRKIWVAHGAEDGGALRLDSCVRACDLPNSGRDRNVCLAALREFLGRPRNAIIGLDFPFGLPGALVDQSSWTDFVEHFGVQYESAVLFRESCNQRARQELGLKELKRGADVEAKTPFSPYNLWMFRQTFYGIRDVLAPLIAGNLVRVWPFQETDPDRPVVIEICPASTLKKLGLSGPYKGRKWNEARTSLVQRFESVTGVVIAEEVRALAIGDPEGDALDAILAAEATYRAWRGARERGRWSENHRIEGFVFS